MFRSDLMPGRRVSEVPTFHPENGNIRVELKICKPLPQAISCLLYLEFDNSVYIDFLATSRPTSNRWIPCRYCVHCVTQTLS